MEKMFIKNVKNNCNFKVKIIFGIFFLLLVPLIIIGHSNFNNTIIFNSKSISDHDLSDLHKTVIFDTSDNFDMAKTVFADSLVEEETNLQILRNFYPNNIESYGTEKDENVIKLQDYNGLTNHTPISINGNADFASKASSNRWKGTGSTSNPYIIENLLIVTNISLTNAIAIYHTDVYFIIRNCVVSANGSYSSSGIFLSFVSNGLLESNYAVNNSLNGFSLYSSNATTIKDNIAENNGAGFFFESSEEDSLINNTAIKNGVGFYITKYDESIVKESPIFFSTHNILINNTAKKNNIGFGIGYSKNQILTNNIALNNYDAGFSIQCSNSTILTGNSAINSSKGFYLEYDSSIKSNNNIFTSNLARDNDWDGFYISGYENNITNNIAQNNKGNGFTIAVGNKNILTNNTSNKNGWGFSIRHQSNNNIITGNSAKNNSNNGFIIFDESSQNNLVGNIAQNNNGNGFEISNTYVICDYYSKCSSHNIIANNSIQNNIGYGVYIGEYKNDYNSENIIKYNSFAMNNNGFVQASNGAEYSVFSYNYWSDFTRPDLNNDGIVDWGYNFPGSCSGFGCYDNYPVTEPYIKPFNPAAPLNLTAKLNQNHLFLNWIIPSNSGGSPIIEYRIFRLSYNEYNSEKNQPYTMIAHTTSLSYTDSNFYNHTLYEYYIRAVNSIGESSNSKIFSFTYVQEFSSSLEPSSSTSAKASPGFEFFTIFVLLVIGIKAIAKRKKIIK